MSCNYQILMHGYAGSNWREAPHEMRDIHLNITGAFLCNKPSFFSNIRPGVKQCRRISPKQVARRVRVASPCCICTCIFSFAPPTFDMTRDREMTNGATEMAVLESRRAARSPARFCVCQWPPRVHRTTRVHVGLSIFRTHGPPPLCPRLVTWISGCQPMKFKSAFERRGSDITAIMSD